MERGAQINRQYGVPFLHRKRFHRADMLDAGIIYDDVDVAEECRGMIRQSIDGFGLAHIRSIVVRGHAALRCDVVADRLDLLTIAEAVEQDVGATGRERTGDPETDTAC